MTERNRSWWKNTTASREIRLFRLLAQGSKSFTQLLKALGWGSQTLTFYLRKLEERGCITSKKHGRNVTYALVPSNPYTAKMLKLSAPSGHDIRVYSRVELDELDEKALIEDWMNTLKFAFLNVLRDYALLGSRRKGEDNELVRRILQVHMQDLADTMDVCGRVLSRRVQAGTIRLDRIKEIQDQMRKDVEEQLTRANRAHLLKSYKKVGNSNGANLVEPPDELEKKLRFKTIERFGGKTSDLSKAVEESIATWVAKDKEHTDKAMNYDWPFNINSTLRICLHPHQHAIF